MKKWLLFSLTTACLLLLFCLAAQAESFSYLAPKRSNPPIIDGNGNDHAWQDALTIRLSGKCCMVRDRRKRRNLFQMGC